MNASAVVVEASGPVAFGNGYETALSLAAGKPTLLLVEAESFDDSYASGLKHEFLTVRKYTTPDVKIIVTNFLEKVTG